ncbi:Spy/CpxP family protein refolding chaperone [Spongiibacter taiwanensis]|uniref:Spy/CpxP family protein refolding chaperone n=1 Tax=Spongiibacter taiwanensis TaxID=1748242 RepID=UPI0020353848|nr:Spy/CpxP family protein refolding chaperone [Spongiibacter taiwanensis]USA43585.1 Spy/CpxP family protein refolding chaperone [Spongiibacter taiwanensis]
MFTRFTATLAAITFFALFSVNSYAQGADLAAAGLQSLVTKLELSDSQKKEVDALIGRYTENATAIRTKVVALQQEMKQIDLGTLTKKEIQKMSADTGRYSAQFTEQTLLLQSGFYAILNKEQRAKFDELRNQVAERRAGALPK